MLSIIVPALWLIVLIVGLPQLSETVYSPSLPDIAHDLKTSEAMTEYTLTIYLFAFAIGTLFWGKLSDAIGRKPCVLAGLFIFILGCVGCYMSASINALLLSRFIQAFGGSIGSVIGQAICRDAFHGPALGKAYSSMGSALAIFPALGPLVGGLIAQYFGWSNIFLFLIAFAIITTLLTFYLLPETHHPENRQPISVLHVASLLLRNKTVLAYGLIVAACNGISFSYFAEGSFYMIELLGLSPSKYGFSFIAIAIATMLGGMLSTKLQNYYSSHRIMQYGLFIIFLSTIASSSIILWHTYYMPLTTLSLIGMIIVTQMGTMFGICMTTSNALALALVSYKWCIGTASSLFGFFYYCVISLFTLGMGLLHNGTLLPMPLYFFTLSIIMILINMIIKEKQNNELPQNS